MDTFGTNKSVLIREVFSFQCIFYVIGTVLNIEVFAFQGVHILEVPLYEQPVISTLFLPLKLLLTQVLSCVCVCVCVCVDGPV